MRVGDEVQLKTGSPPMTITKTFRAPMGELFACVTWVDKQGHEQTGTYPPDALEPAQPEVENEAHEEALRGVEAGYAVILDDKQQPGGRFQVIAMIKGGEFWVTTWQEKPEGEWCARGFVLLPPDAAGKLVQLRHTSGYAQGEGPRPVS